MFSKHVLTTFSLGNGPDYSCETCNYITKDKTNMNKHIKNSEGHMVRK